MTVIENGVSAQARFSVKSFIFNGDEADTDMFVHCKVRICDSIGEDCDLNTHCNGGRKRLVTNKFRYKIWVYHFLHQFFTLVFYTNFLLFLHHLFAFFTPICFQKNIFVNFKIWFKKF